MGLIEAVQVFENGLLNTQGQLFVDRGSGLVGVDCNLFGGACVDSCPDFGDPHDNHDDWDYEIDDFPNVEIAVCGDVVLQFREFSDEREDE